MNYTDEEIEIGRKFAQGVLAQVLINHPLTPLQAYQLGLLLHNWVKEQNSKIKQ